MDTFKHYGECIIKEYSKRLTGELGKGYTITRLKYIRQYYYLCQKSPTLSDLLIWSYCCKLLVIKNYDEIKTELINNEIYKKAKDYSKNKSDLTTYYTVGKLLSEAGKHYGEGIIKAYSKRLTSELGKGYSIRNLWLMLKFYYFKEKVQTLSADLSWSHYCELFKLSDISVIMISTE